MEFPKSLRSNVGKIKWNVLVEKEVQVQCCSKATREGWRRWSSAQPRISVLPFWGVWEEGAALALQAQRWGLAPGAWIWQTSVFSLSVSWQTSLLTSCLFSVLTESWWVKPSQCETPLRALLWQHWKEGRNTAGQSLSHGCCLLWSRFGLKCWLPAGGDFTQDGLWAWGSGQDLLFVSSLNDQAGVSASHLLLCQIPHWITLSPVLTFRRSFFWHKCQEMLLEMKILINIVQDLNCNFSLLGSSYLGSLHLVLRHCASPSPSHQYLWKCF